MGDPGAEEAGGEEGDDLAKALVGRHPIGAGPRASASHGAVPLPSPAGLPLGSPEPARLSTTAGGPP
jgi:hypothetical protein